MLQKRIGPGFYIIYVRGDFTQLKADQRQKEFIKDVKDRGRPKNIVFTKDFSFSLN